MPHKQEIFADLKRRCERGDQVQVSASVSCQQSWWWMDRGSKPCRTLESTTWGYFEDSGRAVSAEQIPPSYRKMAQLGFRHQDDLHYFGHFILFIKEQKILFCISKRGDILWFSFFDGSDENSVFLRMVSFSQKMVNFFPHNTRSRELKISSSRSN